MDHTQSELHKRARLHQSSYIDFLLEYPEHTHGQLVFDEIPNIYLGNIPGISLPNGNSFYLCRVPAIDFIKICELNAFRGKVISQSWQDLWSSDYIYKNYVFEGEGLKNGEFWRQKLAKVQSDVKLENVYPPGVFMGDNVPLLLKIENQKHLDLDLSGAELITELRVIDLNKELNEYLRKNPQGIYHLSPRKFEELIASILANCGYDVSITKATRDGGYDIFCCQKRILGMDHNMIVECKKYKPENKVGIEIARSLLFVKDNSRVDFAMIATTSFFTSGVKGLKASRYDLNLADYNTINDWIKG
jgi:hypothetical protein